MKIKIVKENEYFEVGKILDVVNIKSNHYGCAIMFGEADFITLPNISYIEIIQEVNNEKYFINNRSFPISG